MTASSSLGIVTNATISAPLWATREFTKPPEGDFRTGTNSGDLHPEQALALAQIWLSGPWPLINFVSADAEGPEGRSRLPRTLTLAPPES